MAWEVRVKKLHSEAILPTKGSEKAAYRDVYSLYDVPIPLHENILEVKTGLALEIPDGFFLDVRPRSGFSKYYRIANSPGTIDSDYRGELIILLAKNSFSAEIHPIHKGDRIAQIGLQKVYDFEWLETVDLTPTLRGDKGFGSTGN